MKASLLRSPIWRHYRIGALAGSTLLAASACQSQIFVYNQNGSIGAAAIGEYTVDGAPVNQNLITGLYSSSGIAVAGANLFLFATQSAGAIGEFTTSGATANASLITGISSPQGIAVSGSHVFIGDVNSGTIGEYTTSGTPINASLITGLNGPAAIAVSGSDLFVLNNGSGTVGKYTLGATPGTVTSSNISLITGFSVNQTFGLAVSGSYLFVTSAGSGTVGEYTTSGATVNASLITGLANGPGDTAVSGSYLFVANNGLGAYGAGTIGRYTLGAAPGTVTSANATLVSGLYEPYHIAAAPPTPPTFNIQKAVYLTSTNLVVGFNYQIQASSDLIHWTNQGSVFTATNSNWQSTNYWNVNDWNQLFFQVEAVP
jgi:hypothetical protein